MNKIYNPLVLIILLVIDITWFYFVLNYSNLSVPKTLIINLPITIGVVVYVYMFFKHKTN